MNMPNSSLNACPSKLNMKSIFNLDVDADIWIDAISDDLEQWVDDQPAGWLVDPNVQRRTRVAQEYINPRHELEHCNAECYNLRTWITEQDAAVQHAMRGRCRGALNPDNGHNLNI
jgi:hypothetical protein